MRNKAYKFLKVASIVLVVTILQILWHRDGVFIAGGEQSLSILNSSKTLHLISSLWYDSGLGRMSPFKLPKIPLYIFSSVMNRLFPIYVVQGVLFGFLILLGGLSLAMLTKYFTKNNLVSGLAGLFYVFNLYTQSQVFARFIPYGLFLWAYLPLFLYLWIRWFESRKLLSLILFLISSVIFSPTYSHPSTSITLWIVAFVYSFLTMFSRTVNTKRKLFYLVNIIIGVSLWIVCNLWWICVFLVLQKNVVANVRDWKYGLASLQGVSRDFPNLQLLLLRQKFFFERSGYWGDFYTKWYAYLISLVVFVTMIYGLFSKFKNKRFFVVLIFLGWFICKGTNFPLGNLFFSFTFKNIHLMRIYRNSYEKFGVVFLLPYSLFFALGLSKIFCLQTFKHAKLTSIVILLVSCGILVWPMWTGDIYSSQAKVKVPNCYQEADDFIESQNQNGRILSLPMIPGEGVHYNWGETSYAGLEPSEYLFTKPVIGRTLSYKYADDKYFELYNNFVEGGLLDRVFKETNIRYFIYHNELDTTYSGATTSAQAKKILEDSKNIKYLNSFGDLDIYEYVSQIQTSDIDISDVSIGFSYEKINAAHYLVSIKNAQKPFDIVLKTSYNDLWQARVEKEILGNHFLAYNYANGWEVNKEGDYTLELVFKIWPWD